jgi:phosphoribosylanthranilate isomerase
MGDPAMRVKICGVRRVEDALLAAELGADAIGVLVGQHHPSPDFIGVEQAAAVMRAVSPLRTWPPRSPWCNPTGWM